MRMLKMSILLLMGLAVMTSVVSAAPTRIASITENIDGPFRVAVDANGKLYVNNRYSISIYSSEGNYINSFSVVPVSRDTSARGIAVDASGKIYVGAFTSGKPNYQNSIDIYSSDLSFAGSLGSGNGEIANPSDIAISADGRIYTLDAGMILYNKIPSVKGYDPLNGSSYPFSGSFKNPKAIAVNDLAGASGEVYVIDYRNDPTLGDLPRIQVFDKNGSFLRSFDFPVGNAPMPVGIAADQAGLLYVTTSKSSSVYVIDPANGAISGPGAFNDPAKLMYTIQGIAITKNGLAYVASSGSEEGRGRVDVFALDGYVKMAVNPLSLTFVGKQYAGVNPDPQTIIISNTSGSNGGTLNWSATTDQTWIKLDAVQGSVGPSSASGLTVRADISNLASGTYTGTITIDPGYGQKKTVGVTVSVVPANMLTISSGMLNFIGKMGTTPAAQSITVGVDNLTGSLNWSIMSDSPSWLTVSRAAGTFSPTASSSTVLVSVNTTSLAIGNYYGKLIVDVPGATGTPGTVNVSLMVTSTTKITVNTNRPEAKFSIKGPGSFGDTGSGVSWSRENVPAGDYTVTFDAISGYRKPLPQTKTLAVDGEISFNGTYVSWKELAAKKNIVAAKGPDMRNDAQIKVYKGDGAPVSFDLVALTTRYGANVAVGDVDGDGVAEIIVGSGDGPNNTAIVRIFRADKTLLTEFVPFATMNGVRVVAADLNGDGTAEVLVSPAGGAENTGKVVAYAYDVVQKKMIPTGIDFTAYTYAYGANMAVADIDGSGKPAIVTAPGFGGQNPALIKVWAIDTTAKVGSWTVSANPLKQILLPGTEGATIAAADVDNDGKSEIIAATSGDHAIVTIIKADGSQTRFKVSERQSVNLAAADLDGDGLAEIIAAAGPERSELESGGDAKSKYGDRQSGRQKDKKEKEAEFGDSDHERGSVRVFSASGALLYTVVPFEDAKGGISIAVGDLGL